ncbi:MAG: hypothetical protein ABI665_03820 [Vicinamibacterales bacterium]
MSVWLKGADRTYEIDCTSAQALVRIEEATALRLPVFIWTLQREPDDELARQFLSAVLVELFEPDELDAILEDIGGIAVLAAAVDGLEAHL